MKKIGFKLIHFLPVFFLILLLCLHCRYSFVLANERDELMPPLAANIILCIINIVIYYSFLKTAIAYDISTDPPDKTTNTFLFVIKNPGFYVSTAITALYDVIFTSSLSSRLNDIINNKALSIVISLLTIIVGSFFLWLYCAKKYCDLNDNKKTRIKNAVIRYVITYVTLSLLSSFIPIFAAQANVFAFIGRFVLIGLTAFSVVYFTVKYIKALTARKSFLLKLKAVCDEKGYIITDMYRPYSSVFFDNGKINFRIHDKENITEHKLISCLNKPCSVFLFDEGGIIKDLPVKLGRNITLFSFRHKLMIESERCYLIFTSPPLNVSDGSSNGKILIDNNMTVGNMTYFTSTGFLNTLERNQIK